MNLIHRTSQAVGSRASLLLVVVLLASGPLWGFSEGWWTWIDRIIYVATLILAIVVQAAQNRDTAAIQAKLDGLIAAIDKADDNLQGIEKR